MPSSRPTRLRTIRRLATAVGVGAVAAASVAALTTPSIAAPTRPALGATAAGTLGNNLSLLDVPIGFSDVDARVGTIAATSSQLAQVASLGAVARWNRFGTPESLIHYSGFLGTGYPGNAVSVARAWMREHAALFRLTSAQVDALTLVNDQRMTGSAGHSVLFRQNYGALPAAQDGLIDVTTDGAKVVYVSSSATGPQTAPPKATLTPLVAWTKAAGNVGRPVAITKLSTPIVRSGWTMFTAPGFAQPQRARLVAVPMPSGAARPAYETIVLDSQGGRAIAYTVFVDAVTGAILMRYNRVDNDQAGNQFTAAFTETGCGAPVPGGTVDSATKQILVAGTSTVPTNDILIKLLHNGVAVAQSDDTGVGQEELTYAPAAGVPAGDYFVEVCPSPAPAGPFVAPLTASGIFVSSDTAAPSTGGATVPYPPKWKYFFNAPPLSYASTDTRKLGCWVTTGQTGCDRKEQNLASRAPWDVNINSGLPTFTTAGNNAVTADASLSPLSPGGAQRPVAPDRSYTFPWQNQWHTSKCDPTSLASPNRADNDAAVTNLFSGHNRFHDFSYRLGFTEDNYNAQVSNFGNGGQQNDPELGDVQAGSIDGGAPSYEGRDNANQIALNDGIPGITNQYLFQPIPDSFYAACSDGDFDTTVFGHEYTHLISNRMVGGPDDGLVGAQAGSMGESWSDLDALEYLHEYGYIPQDGENDWAEGPYVTGNKTRGIRNYGLNADPLNYSDIGYDLTDAEVHADGEVWNAVNYDIRQALVGKYNSAYPATDRALQLRCADGVVPADECPGNRRWIQMVYDGWLMQPSSDSMLDARDSYLAADMIRFNGADQATLWRAFAKRGFGTAAATNGTDDTDPTPSFVARVGSQAGTLALTASSFDSTAHAKISGAAVYVGPFSAGVTPVATTDSNGLATVRLEPGTYLLTVRKAGYGIQRFTVTVAANTTTAQAAHLTTNLASASNGATITADDTTTTDAAALIDDNEATNLEDDTAAPVNVSTPSFTVQLDGGAHNPVMVRSVKVSAFTQQTGGRFDALRQFAIAACTASVTNPNCADPAGFTTIYTSPADAFPGGLPRPLAPDLNLRNFDVPDTMATHLKLIVLNNQCTGGPAYQGDQDNDPTNNSDCVTGADLNPLLTPAAPNVKIAEFEAYSYDASTRPPGDPVVAVTASGPSTAARGSTFAYAVNFTNLGPKPSANAEVIDTLPTGVEFVSADGGGRYDAATRTVHWPEGTVAVTYTGTVHLTVRATGLPTTAVLNQPTFAGDETLPLPAAVLTTIT